jgi:hypothetical protein
MSQDEMQRKKERIMMQSLRRKQEGEDARRRKEDESRMRREDDNKKEEEKARKKEEERAKRDAILEQHRLKKQMERLAEEQVRILLWTVENSDNVGDVNVTDLKLCFTLFRAAECPNL